VEQIDSNHCGVGAKRRRNHAKVIFGWARYFLEKPVGRQKLSRLLRTRPGQSRRSVRIPFHTEVMFSVDMRTIRGTTWNISQTANSLRRWSSKQPGFSLFFSREQKAGPSIP
jgi:hypothetical protein